MPKEKSIFDTPAPELSPDVAFEISHDLEELQKLISGQSTMLTYYGYALEGREKKLARLTELVKLMEDYAVKMHVHKNPPTL
jgi:hypothetical protein